MDPDSGPFLLFTALEAAAASGGTLRPETAMAVGIHGAVLDSRSPCPGAVFVPLKGERADGHDFIGQAFGNGASASFVDESVWKETGAALLTQFPGKAFIVVRDSLRAFQAVAAHHVGKFPNLLKIGVTGSSGKTTTKEFIASAFRAERNTIMNEGNLNSDSGLPLSVLGIRPEHEVGVFEMGMNRAGEMAELARVLKPNAVVITNIGTAHIGILGSQDAIALEKKSAFSEFGGNDVAFLPEHDGYFEYLKKDVRGRVIPYGMVSTPGFRGAEDLGLDGTSLNWEGLQIRVALPGRHNVLNALAAVSVALHFGVGRESIKRGIESVRALSGRSEVIVGKYLVLKDCYNANPDSMDAAVGFADEVSVPGRKAYVLGSMFELGSDAESAHRALGSLAAGSMADAVFFFGSDTKVSFESAREAGFDGALFHAETIEELAELCKSWLRDDDFILLKASRGMALERLIPLIGMA